MATLESSTVTRDLGYAVPSVAADYPATVNSGDQLVMEVYARNAASIATPSGWSLEFSNTNFFNRVHVFSRTADGTEAGGTVTLTFDTDREAIVKISRFSSASGIDVHGAGSDDFLANVSSPSVTTTVANTLLYFGLAHTSDGTGISAPSGTTAGSVDALRSRVALAHATQAAASAGATSAAAWTNPENFAWPYTIAIAPASSAATLSSPTSASITQTGATIGATTDDATGTLYGVVTASATEPSEAQIKAGQDHTGSAAAGSGSNASLSVGANTIAITGLTTATTYYYYLLQDNGADSNIVSGTFETTFVPTTMALDIVIR